MLQNFFWRNLSSCQRIFLKILNEVTPIVRKLLRKKVLQHWPPVKPEASSLNKSSRLAPTLGVTKIIIVSNMILVTLCCAT
jgi:hypothetical protein